MPKKSKRRETRKVRKGKRSKRGTRKQLPIIMIGCSNCGKKGYHHCVGKGCLHCGGNGCQHCGGKGCQHCGGKGCQHCAKKGCQHCAKKGCQHCAKKGCQHCGGKGCQHCAKKGCQHCGKKSCQHCGKKSCQHCGRNPHNGGSGCGSNGCPIAPYQFGGSEYTPILGIGQNGGNCSSCQVPQSGGGLVPGPFVGSAWNPNNLPGMNGISGDRNYLSPVDVVKNPQQQMSMNNSGYNIMGGGYKKSKRGGGLIPQDLVNLGNSFKFGAESTINALNGYKAPVNPLPYKGQLISNNRIMI